MVVKGSGVPVAYEPFSAALLSGESVSGRSVDQSLMDHVRMLLSGDYPGKIHRISYDPDTPIENAAND